MGALLDKHQTEQGGNHTKTGGKRPRIYVSFSQDMYTRFAKHADNEDLPVGTLARKILLGHLRKHPHVPKPPRVKHPEINEQAVEQLTFQLQKMGNNINQWTIGIHQDGVVKKEDIAKLVGYIKKLDGLIRKTLLPESEAKAKTDQSPP